MASRARIFVLLPVLLALAACTPIADPAPSIASSAVATESPSPTQAAPQPLVVDPEAYRIDGEGTVGSSDGVWWGDYAFYTDASKSVWCVIIVSSEQPGRVICQIVDGFEDQVTYAAPSAVTDQCLQGSATDRDGYEVGLGLFQSIATDSGFFGCREAQIENPQWFPVTKVLPDAATISVEKFSCTVNGGIATCSRPGESGSIQFGLSIAAFIN